MALSKHLENLITAYKAMPNGYRRNKINSHLEDALAHAKLLEQEDPRLASPAEEASLDAMAPPVQGTTVPAGPGGCVCSPGMRVKSCTAPEHVA